MECYCELANKTTQQLYKLCTPCLDDHHFKEEELKSVGELSDVCSQIVLICLSLARIGGPDILWSVNKLARAITKWTRACDKRLARLISYIHFTTSEYKQYVTGEIQLKHCRLGLFQDSDFAGDLEVSKSTSGGTLCTFGSHTFVPVSWVCKKQTSVSHSSTEPQNISLDAGLRMDGIPALDLWDLVIDVLHSNPNQKEKFKKEREDPLHDKASEKQVKSHCNTQVSEKQTELSNVDFVSSNVNSSHKVALLYIFEDNEAVIKMTIEGRSPTLRHVSRTNRVALDWLFDRTNLDQKLQSRYVDSRNQFADLLTQGHFTRDEWNHLLCLFNISLFSSQSCSR